MLSTSTLNTFIAPPKAPGINGLCTYRGGIHVRNVTAFSFSEWQCTAMLSVVDEAVRRTLAEVGERSVVTAGTTLFSQNDPCKGVFLLLSGEVVTYIGEVNSSRVCPRTARAGSLLGVPATVNGTAYSMSAVASKDAEVVHISREKLDELMRSFPAIAFAIIDILSSEVREMRELMKAPNGYMH